MTDDREAPDSDARGRTFCLPPATAETLLSLIRAGVISQVAGELALTTPGGERIVLPQELACVVGRAVELMAAGRAVMVSGANLQVTAYESEDYFGISPQRFNQLLDDGELPCSGNGRLRRVLLTDLLEYEKRQRAQRREAMKNLVGVSQELGLYND